MKLKILAVMTAISVLAAMNVWSAPLTEKAIPIYSGAVADKNAKAQLEAEQKDTPEGLLLGLGLTLSSKSLNVYSCSSPVEEVFRFYLEKLGAKQLTESVYPLDLEPGETTPVDYHLSFHELRETVDSSSGTVLYPGKLIKKTLTANRKPYQPDKWVQWVSFEWSVREKNGDLTGYALIVDDRSFSEDFKSYKTRTWIQIHRQTYQSEDESDYGDEFDAQVAARIKTMKQPTEKELGIPVYPGSVFNKELSAGMSLGDEEVFYIFLTNELLAKVVTFYEQKLGKKAANNGGKYMIALKGKLPYPDEGIAIEPNNLGGSAKTVIAFRKLLER